MEIELNLDLVKKAYKKLKGNIYFDKTQLPLLHKIVCFEDDELDCNLEKIVDALKDEADNSWENYKSDITNKINVLVYPKKLCKWNDERVIFNTDDEPIVMEKVQLYIDMPVKGHIIGALWVLVIGTLLDKGEFMYEHSYGNRLRKTLNDSDNITYSPYLFEPYFSQYESWRDRALKYAEAHLDDKQDALILTMDLRSYFYSVHVPKKSFESILNEIGFDNPPQWIIRIHNFVYEVLKSYSDAARNVNNNINLNLDLGERIFLPIGFLPSNILSNWVLTPFDKAICQYINPVYYGRYVDDIIIVDKVEKNSILWQKAKGKKEDKTKLTAHDVIKHYFCSCFSTENKDISCQNPLFIVDFEDNMTGSSKVEKSEEKEEIIEDDIIYYINNKFLPHDETDKTTSNIQVQNKKVKVFYLRHGSARALLDCFRTQIGQNASEFRTLPDMECVLDKNDYSEIFKLQNDETLHKLRGVSSVSLDRFAFSKFLGKYRKASGMIRDKKENAFEKDLLRILDKRILIENYTLWERLLEIMVVNEHFDSYELLAKNILEAIYAFYFSNSNSNSNTNFIYKSLLDTLKAAIYRTSSLCWGIKIYKILDNIHDKAKKLFIDYKFDINLPEMRIKYCKTRMVNKYVIPLPIGLLNYDILKNTEQNSINICRFECFIEHANWDAFDDDYIYFPYIVTPQEISYSLACEDIAKGYLLKSAKDQLKLIKDIYSKWNFNVRDTKKDENEFNEVQVKSILRLDSTSNKSCYAISIISPKSNKIKVGISNARLYIDDFKSFLKGTPKRTYARYKQIAKILREAVHENVDLLVMPENYLPWEWVPYVSQYCSMNQIALVTGIEHVKSYMKKGGLEKAYNLTAVILPYCKDNYKFAHVVYHQKTHLSPEELRYIKGYRLEPFEGNEYQLFKWRDLWFSVYCCYELASITERSIFKSYADLTIAVEWNKDVLYFSSIVESLCRDLHCYCIQSNSSDYGDSRVMSPSKTETRDIIKTKGGINPTILVDEIDINDLREYQRKEYELQRDDPTYKPTPPDFDRLIVEQKQNGTLFDNIK